MLIREIETFIDLGRKKKIMSGKWLTLLEYAHYRKKSISTIRRYIKNNRVKYEDRNGKYYVWARNFDEVNSNDEGMLKNSIRELEQHIYDLKSQLKEKEQIIIEYKMLNQALEQYYNLEEEKKANKKALKLEGDI